jgi:hypothetical protein
MSDLPPPLPLIKPENTGKVLGSHEARIHHLLQTYSARGLRLDYIAGPNILNRSLAVLKKYCRRYMISFPDYVPKAMRPEPPPKEKKPKKPRTSKRYLKSQKAAARAEQLAKEQP